MRLGKRSYWVVGLVAVMGAAAIFTTIAAGGGDSRGAPGQIDDGAELLDQASISLEQAIAAAQAAYDGALGEVDVEYYKGTLVFNVDIGPKDVKVNAGDGTVLGFAEDDNGDNLD